jgi:hypothetical protein
MAVPVSFAGCSLPKCRNASGTPRERHRNINRIFTTGSGAVKIVIALARDLQATTAADHGLSKPVGRRTAAAPTGRDSKIALARRFRMRQVLRSQPGS